MGSIYITIVKGEADWITLASAHLLKDALPNCAGIFWFDPDAPADIMKDKSEGWSLYLCGHGNKNVICGVTGKKLAQTLGPRLPSTLGLIFVMSCSTGKGPAQEFCANLKGKDVIIRAPDESTTFTPGLGFRVLNPPSFTSALESEYTTLVSRFQPPNGDTTSIAAGKKSGQDISAHCARLHKATAGFWPAFSKKFSGCFSTMGTGWKELST